MRRRVAGDRLPARPAIITENEEAEIDAASSPDCDADSQELPAPDPSFDTEGLVDEADHFDAVVATTELHGEAHDSVETTPELPEFAPQDSAMAPVPSFLGPAPPRWDGPTVPGQIDAHPVLPQAYVLRKPERRSRHRSGRHAPYLLIAVLILVAFHSAVIGWRREVVKIAPQTASLYRAIGLPVNLRGLSISNVTTVVQLHEGVPLLLVEGTLANTSTRAVKVLGLRVAVRNSAGQELYNWTEEPERRNLSTGESLTFRTRLASPPPEAHEVVVRFFNRDDTAGMQQTGAMKASQRGQP
jgi:hypothetical protein